MVITQSQRQIIDRLSESGAKISRCEQHKSIPLPVFEFFERSNNCDMRRHILNNINGFRDANDGAAIIKKLEKIDLYQCTDNNHVFEVDCMTRAPKRSRRTAENNLGGYSAFRLLGSCAWSLLTGLSCLCEGTMRYDESVWQWRYMAR